MCGRGGGLGWPLNPYASGTRVYLDGIQYSTATGAHHFPSGEGPKETQRMIFGSTGRTDWRDSRGHSWRPATEFVTRLAGGKDSGAQGWWTNATDEPIHGTADPELHRYGVHAKDFWVNVPKRGGVGKNRTQGFKKLGPHFRSARQGGEQAGH